MRSLVGAFGWLVVGVVDDGAVVDVVVVGAVVDVVAVGAVVVDSGAVDGAVRRWCCCGCR